MPKRWVEWAGARSAKRGRRCPFRVVVALASRFGLRPTRPQALHVALDGPLGLDERGVDEEADRRDHEGGRERAHEPIPWAHSFEVNVHRPHPRSGLDAVQGLLLPLGFPPEQVLFVEVREAGQGVGNPAECPVVSLFHRCPQIGTPRSMTGRAGGGKPSGQLGRERLQELDEGDECQMASQEYGDDDCRDKDERQEWRPPLPPRLVVIVVPLAHPPSMVGRAGGSKPLGLYSGAGEATKRHSVHTQLMTRTWSPLKRHAKSETTRDTTLQL